MTILYYDIICDYLVVGWVLSLVKVMLMDSGGGTSIDERKVERIVIQ